MTDKQKAIMELQQRLRDISKVDKDVLSVIPDGIFGEETENSVRSFQRKQGLTETGVVDFELWDKIYDEHKKALFMLSEPIQVISIKKEDLPLVLGQISKEVHMLNMMLNSLSERYSNFQNVGHSDEFTPATKNEIEKWQKVIGHEVTGEVDKLTWNRLAEQYLLRVES